MTLLKMGNILAKACFVTIQEHDKNSSPVLGKAAPVKLRPTRSAGVQGGLITSGIASVTRVVSIIEAP
jgi:hypothetical protein